MKKRILWIGGIVFLMVAALLLIPFPRKISYEGSAGLAVNDSGETLSESELFIKVEGWYLSYLIRRDTVKGSVSCDILYDFTGPVFQNDEGMRWIAITGYSEEKNQYVGGYLFFRMIGNVL